MGRASTKAIGIDPYVVDSLMPDLTGHDRRPTAFLIYLFLWRRTHDALGGWTAVRLREMAEGTGLSKRAVQDAITHLIQRRLVRVRRAGLTAVGEYRVERPWRERTRR